MTMMLMPKMMPLSAGLSIAEVTTAQATGTATTLAVPVPPGVQDGDLLILIAGCANTSGFTIGSVSGWTNIVNSTANPFSRMMRRVWSTGDPMTYNVVISPSSGTPSVFKAAVMLRIPKGVYGIGTQASGTTLTLLSQVFASSGIAIVAARQAASGITWTPPAGFDLITNFNATSSIAVYAKRYAASEATGALTFTPNTGTALWGGLALIYEA